VQQQENGKYGMVGMSTKDSLSFSLSRRLLEVLMRMRQMTADVVVDVLGYYR
jgi:hypothetical protein